MSRKFYPALRGRIGNWDYFSCLMSMDDVVRRVNYAKEIRESKKLSEFIQRYLTPKRAERIAEYLCTDESRFFNSLVVGVYEGDPNWHEFTSIRPKSSLVDLNRLEGNTRSAVGYLSFTGDERLFALDGQHRLSGMRGAVERKKALRNELISLIFVAHKDTKAGRQRSRHLFSVLNKNAIPISKGERIALDESDVMAITVRRLIEESKLFNDKRIIFRPTDNILESDAEGITTIGNLYEVLTTLFPILYGKSRVDLKNSRPSDDVLDEYYKFALDFFVGLRRNFGEFNSYFETDSPADLVSANRNRDGGHVLFRPVGLRIMAEVVKHLASEHSIAKSIQVAARLPVELNQEPYLNTIWKSVSRKMEPGNRVVTRDVLLYMLGEKSGTNALRRKYAKALEVEEDGCQLPDRLS